MISSIVIKTPGYIDPDTEEHIWTARQEFIDKLAENGLSVLDILEDEEFCTFREVEGFIEYTFAFETEA